VNHARIRATLSDLVLEVGSGSSFHSTSDILCDRYVDDVYDHRSGRKLVADLPFVAADITALPFADKTFDYVIANQVIEHVPDPARALDEISRVGLRCHVSMPSEFHEMICTMPQHIWVVVCSGCCTKTGIFGASC
jgi:SAM-dependent methyltransferase